MQNGPWKVARTRMIGALIAALAVFLPHSAAWAQPAEDSYAVLIVGDEGDAEMLRREKILISEMGKLIRAGSRTEKLPIYSYHFNKERERAYCENKLNVLAEDLLFVGVVSLENKVPMKVVYRIDRIVNPARAAKDILAQTEAIVEDDRPEAVKPVAPSTPTPAKQPPASTTPSTAPSTAAADGEGFRIQLGSFTLVNYAEDRKVDAKKAGFDVVIVETVGPDGDTIYKVLSPVFKARGQADEALAKYKAAGFEQAFLTRAPAK